MSRTPEFLLDEYDYELPEELIAQEPIEPRDAARLMVVRRATRTIEHRIFRELPDLLDPGDLLVVNDSRVLPARLFGQRTTGGKVEILLVQPLEGTTTWLALARPARKLRPGEDVTIVPREGVDERPATARIVERRAGGQVVVALDPLIAERLERYGHVPLPPYIRRPLRDPERYQTVYAAHPGSVAAPTAGLHFTERLLAELRERGIEIAPLTLHVGIGTFKPIEVEDVRLHTMHAEWYRVPARTVEAIVRTKRAGHRVVAVGTTAARTLESIAEAVERGATGELTGWTDLYIYPGYRWRVVDALITNFHLPRSTLILLVASFAGRDLILEAYREAVRERYRFYSFGDAMLIL
ncbi:MAG: tRNA preQ1(34) S-adenosylmethionine ribosyltransferase-isomerase QueA [Thermomicrobium sp.]|nr:tRNA preQ1(34) S-adenosylmethionine ribosyltransferase-isomerase QueA [Thermomicrobium sp.]